jgi:hypothetical protein
MEAEEEARIRTVVKEYAKKSMNVRVSKSLDLPDKLLMTAGPYGQHPPFFVSCSPAILLRALADLTEKEHCVSWSIDFLFAIDDEAAGEIVRISSDTSRASKLEGLCLDYSPTPAAIPVIAELFSDVPCTLNRLYIPGVMVSRLLELCTKPRELPCPFIVNFMTGIAQEDVDVSTLTAFAATARLKHVMLFGLPDASDQPTVPMTDMEYLHVDPVGLITDVNGTLRCMVPLLNSCPNLTRLRLDMTASLNSSNAGSILVPMFADGIAKLRKLKELNVTMKDVLVVDWQAGIIASLSGMTQLQELTMHAMFWTNLVILNELAATHPRLRLMMIHYQNGSHKFDEILRRKMEWLQTVALSTYLPLGDLNRELAAYV